VSSPTPTVSIRGWSKTFAARPVVSEVDLDLFPGAIHGLIGQNGSGKSTLIKILGAFHEPDEGARLFVRGEQVELPLKPGEPRKLGIVFVHQELGLIDNASVVENVRVGSYEGGALSRISWRAERREVAAALQRYNVRAQPKALISSLDPVDRAQVAIVRALQELGERKDGVLVLDEPTPHLPRDGVDRLFRTIREVSASGVAVLFVTHRMDEVREITDVVTIIRDGRLVVTAPTASLSDSEITRLLLGFNLDRLYPPEAEPARPEVAASYENVSSARVHGLSVNLHRGEIVGVTGLLQQGWDEVPYLAFGARPATGGRLRIDGDTVELGSLTPVRAMRLGLALVPAERLRDGAVGEATVTENLTLTTLRSDFAKGRLNHRHEKARSRRLLHEHAVVPPDPAKKFVTLSGGNQQKVVLAKWFETKPRVMLLHEPTQGVDIGARRQLYGRLRNAAAEGCAILIASAEFEDLAHLCDRVIVFRDGRPHAELSGESLNYQRILHECFGGDPNGNRPSPEQPER